MGIPTVSDSGSTPLISSRDHPASYQGADVKCSARNGKVPVVILYGGGPGFVTGVNTSTEFMEDDSR